MDKTLTVEQKAHDLAVAYASYLAITYETVPTTEDFYQDYENAFSTLLPIVEHYNKQFLFLQIANGFCFLSCSLFLSIALFSCLIKSSTSPTVYFLRSNSSRVD